MNTKLFIISFILIILNSMRSQIILTEIMFDTAGDENNDEFIEIYNNSTDTVDLTGWMVSDDGEIDLLIKYNGFDNMILKPYQYCVIMDSSYYLNSTYYEELIPDSILRVMINDGAIGQYGLSNSYDETITIYDNDSTIISFYTYSRDQEQGYSDERVDLNDNIWDNSKVLNGTPGFKNSVSYYDYDLEISLYDISGNLQPGVDFEIDLIVKNLGLNPIENFRCNAYHSGIIYDYHDFNGTLLSGDSVFVSFIDNIETSGSDTLVYDIETDNDENLSNNYLDIPIYIRFNDRPIALNEFMKYPNSDQCEFIEIVNISGDSVYLNDFGLTDSNKEVVITLPEIFLQPDEYYVVAENDLIYNFHSIDLSKIYVNSSLPSLNNDTDCIYILDKMLSTIDSFSYRDLNDDYGISIEKINPEFDSYMLTNWVLSVNTATPTKENSVFQDPEDVSGHNEFTLYPKTVTPNNDGNNDNLIISYDFNSAYIFLTVKIYNIKGQQVAIPANSIYTSSSNDFVWDCKDNNGMTVNTGAYICFLSVKNSDGKITNLKKAFYVTK